MGDVDLLIRAGDLNRIEQFLTSRAYTFAPPSDSGRDWHLHHGYHLAYQKRVAGLPATCIELHWRLAAPSSSRRVDHHGMWARAVPATIAGVPARTLCPEDTLLHLCLHACKHRLIAGLRPYMDIAELIRFHSAQIDWSTITRRAFEWDIADFVHVPLVLSREVLGAGVPDGVLDELTPAVFDQRLVDTARQVLADNPRDATLFEDFFGLTWGSAGGARRHVLAKMLGPEVVAARYGIPSASARVWYRYPQRLAHLCRSYAPEFWRFLRRGRLVVTHARDRSRLTHFVRPIESPTRPHIDAR
jgi:hypothetical protein